MPNRKASLAAAVSFLLTGLPGVPAGAVEPRTLPASVSVLTRDDFASREWFSLADVLDQVPGVDLTRTAYRGTTATGRLRGFGNPNALIVALDGRPITHEFDGSVDLSQIPLNAIERVEITRGGSSVLYGPAAAGVVNIVTARPIRQGLTVDLGTGVGRDGVRMSNGRFGARGRYGDAVYVGGIEDSGGFTENDVAEYTNHFANYTRSFRHGGYVGAEYLYTKGKSGTPDGTSAPFDRWDGRAEQVANDKTGFFRREFQLIRLLAASPKALDGIFRLELTQGLTHLDQAASPTAIFDQDNTASDARLLYERKGLDVGAEAGSRRRTLESIGREKEDVAAAFAAQRIEAGAWTFVPGVRWDNHSRGGDAPTVRAAVLYEPVPGWTASLTGQRAPRFATFDEIFDATGKAKELDPEIADTIDAGLVWAPGRFRVAATYFTGSARDVIAVGPSGGFENGARERSKGVESEVSARIGKGVWSEVLFKGNWTYQDARRKDIGATGYGDAPFAPRNLGFASADYVLPWKLTLTNELRYEGPQYSGTDRTGTKLPPFTIWNFRLSAHIHTAVAFFAVGNVLGRHYAEATGAGGTLAPQPNRTYWAGIDIRFID